jgi:hypothetical protein
MNRNRNGKRHAWLLASAVGLGLSGGAFASSDTPTMEEMLAASPNRLTVQEREDLERRAASGESARLAPEGTYTPNAAAADPRVAATDVTTGTTGSATDAANAKSRAQGDARRATPAIPATPATPADPGVAPASPATPATPAVPSHKSEVPPTTATPADQADSRDDAGARNDVAPRKREVPVDRERG